MFAVLLGWKNTHDSWINLYFLSLWTINCDAVFDNLSVNLFALTNLNEVCTFSDRNPNTHIWIQKITFFKMTQSQLETFVLRKGVMKIGKTYVDSLSKRLINFSVIERYPRPEHFAGHKCDKKRLNVQPPQSRKWLYHWCFPQLFGANINHRIKWKWQALWFKLFSYSTYISSSNYYFKAFQNPYFGKFGRTAT